MHQMKSDGYTINMPSSADQLREEILNGNSSKFGQEANVAARVDANWIINNTPWLEEIENQWGSAPGRIQSDGNSVFILGKDFGSVFVGLQPAFGYEGDPMRLLFEKVLRQHMLFLHFTSG